MPTARSAAEVGARPPCDCHGEPMRWNRRHDLVAGGYWRCRVRYQESARKWREAHASELADYMSTWRVMNRERRRAYAYGWRYGMAKGKHDALLETQGGLCAICDIPAAESAKGILHIDHDHTTGRVRGLLCNRCNSALERVERPGWTARATAYLRK